MSQYVDTPTKCFPTLTAIGQYLRVKLSAGLLVVAGVGVTDEPVELGTMLEPSFGISGGEQKAVVLRSKQGTVKMVASAAISAGVAVYGAASGKISTTASGAAIGIALEASTADNDVIEVLRY